MDFRRLLACLSALTFTALGQAEDSPALLRLDQIQVVGTHNSYHVRPPEAVLRSAIAVERSAREWDYSREALDKQLDRGIRSFELDMHLVKDEWHVMHVPILDPGSTVKTFRDAITVVKAWSDNHPRHVPISFLMELKEEGIVLGRGKGIRQPEKVDLERLDEVIRDVYPADRLITPDAIRGSASTLHDAIRAKNWPTLSKCAGKVFFIMHETGRNRDLYTDGHESLEGRAMFVESTPGDPHAAVVVVNNPSDPRINKLANEGYLVRTRADSQGNKRQQSRDAALASGAHILTTDYPIGEKDNADAFQFPEPSPARGNPITAPVEFANKPIAEPIAAK